ncbi:hypothetical protein [Pedosphaera parvula]|uniref:hypothetical protein n=1 Tax=Pedosphaera parvula TaxID=1032527 RepID=UPI0005905DC0|nr:hypothetical protein [Pedosphaera parvula]
MKTAKSAGERRLSTRQDRKVSEGIGRYRKVSEGIGRYRTVSDGIGRYRTAKEVANGEFRFSNGNKGKG